MIRLNRLSEIPTILTETYIDFLVSIYFFRNRSDVAEFVGKLKSTADGDGSLLDHSLLFYGSGMANSNVHATDPLPMIVVGGGAGKANRHLVLKPKTEIGNLWLSVANKAGADMPNFGESTGTVDFF